MANRADQEFEIKLQEPRFEDSNSLLIAGLRHDYTPSTMNQIPDQWKNFMPHIGKVPGQVGRIAYGLCFVNQTLNEISYLSGVQISSSEGLPEELTWATVPAQKYAVFTHQGHVSTLWQTCDAIQNQWFPASGYNHVRATADVPDFFERYGESFDPTTGLGGIEVWVPIKS